MIQIGLPGTGAVMPLPERWLSCLALRAMGRGVLFDCGEGTQIALREMKWGFHGLDAVCLSHVHADHVSGLVGLLFTLANSGREDRLSIYGPPGISAVVAGLRLVARVLPFQVEVIELWAGESFAVGPLRLTCEFGQHSAPCLCYRADLPRLPRFDPERAGRLGVPVTFWRVLQQGEAVETEVGRYVPGDVLGPPRRGISVAYVTDTRPTPGVQRLCQDADVLVCEATFGDDLARAKETGHMTFAEAAELAARSGVRRLILTHFSPTIADPAVWLPEATSHFTGVIVGRDGWQETLRFDDE